MGGALVVASSEKGRQFLADLLRSGGATPVSLAASGSEARRLLLQEGFDLVVVNTPLSDEFGSEFAIAATESTAAGVLLLVKHEIADDVAARVEDYGVAVVGKPLNRLLFHQAVKLANASRRRLANLANENVRLQYKIEEIRLVDRAKCVLIQYLNMTETQAHRYIEKQAMDLRTTRRQIAEGILKTYEV